MRSRCKCNPYFTKTQITQINNHLPGHLSQPNHLGTLSKTSTGTDRELTIYFKETIILNCHIKFFLFKIVCPDCLPFTLTNVHIKT